MTTKPFSVRLPDEIRTKLAYISDATRRSQSSIAGQMLEKEVIRQARKIRAIEEAKEDIKTGIFHSGEQVVEWLDSWGSDDELSSPEPDILP